MIFQQATPPILYRKTKVKTVWQAGLTTPTSGTWLTPNKNLTRLHEKQDELHFQTLSRFPPNSSESNLGQTTEDSEKEA